MYTECMILLYKLIIVVQINFGNATHLQGSKGTRNILPQSPSLNPMIFIPTRVADGISIFSKIHKY